MKDRLGTVLSTKEFLLLQYRTDIIFLQTPRYGVGPERKKQYAEGIQDSKRSSSTLGRLGVSTLTLGLLEIELS